VLFYFHAEKDLLLSSASCINDFMTNSEVLKFPTLDPSPDWRAALLESYKNDGFEIHDIVPKPPERPTLRLADNGDTYDYDTKDLPFGDGDDIWVAKHAAMMTGLAAQYEVRIASPTLEMVQNDPNLTLDSHMIIMVRDSAPEAA
jgi:hypothetical protein